LGIKGLVRVCLLVGLIKGK